MIIFGSGQQDLLDADLRPGTIHAGAKIDTSSSINKLIDKGAGTGCIRCGVQFIIDDWFLGNPGQSVINSLDTGLQRGGKVRASISWPVSISNDGQVIVQLFQGDRVGQEIDCQSEVFQAGNQFRWVDAASMTRSGCKLMMASLLYSPQEPPISVTFRAASG